MQFTMPRTENFWQREQPESAEGSSGVQAWIPSTHWQTDLRGGINKKYKVIKKKGGETDYPVLNERGGEEITMSAKLNGRGNAIPKEFSKKELSRGIRKCEREIAAAEKDRTLSRKSIAQRLYEAKSDKQKNGGDRK